MKIWAELKEIRRLLARLVGTADLLPEEQFSVEALDRAAKEFQKLSMERGEWIADQDIDKIIKKAPYRAGKFIISEFKFSNYFRKGHTYYFKKKDLAALAEELKKRNIDLKRYMELKESQQAFEKDMALILQNKAGKKAKAYHLPPYLSNITTTPPKLPPVELVREDLKNLKAEFFEHKLSEYIDIYKDNYAMLKSMYYYQRYIDPAIRRRCQRWCDNFRIANKVLEEITKKKEVFVPTRDEDMIQL
jgi:hypothetical protein